MTIFVYQCAECKQIVGDTEVEEAGDAGIEMTHVANFETTRGRIRCQECKEPLGSEDSQGRIFYMPDKVTKYVVQSAKLIQVPVQSSTKRSKRDDDTMTWQEFQDFKLAHDRDMVDCKETIMVLFEKIERLGG
ncbi:hypothetical protein BASA81_012373 [Batrachochytrium salamandrivorans]|nr:hypothetical protein BASA81_012373 [Batrachochytrium salamandrivorans]